MKTTTIIKTTLAIIFVLSLSSQAYAAAGDESSLGNASKAGGVLKFTPSGNTLLGWTLTDGSAYQIGSACVKTSEDNGMKYGMKNDYSGYYQQVQTEKVGEAVAPTTVGGTGWTPIGGAEAEDDS